MSKGTPHPTRVPPGRYWGTAAVPGYLLERGRLLPWNIHPRSGVNSEAEGTTYWATMLSPCTSSSGQADFNLAAMSTTCQEKPRVPGKHTPPSLPRFCLLHSNRENGSGPKELGTLEQGQGSKRQSWSHPACLPLPPQFSPRNPARFPREVQKAGGGSKAEPCTSPLTHWHL